MTACSPFGPAGEFAASRHGAFTRSQAADHGLTHKVISRLLRDGHLREPVPGVLVITGSPPTWRQRLYVASLASKASGAVATRASGGLHGMDEYGPGPVELLVPGRRHIQLPGLVMRQGPLPPEDIVVVDGIRTTGIARTLCDLGSIDPIQRVTMAFEWAWRTGVSLTWIEQTAQRLEHPTRPGPRVVLGLVARARGLREPTASALEVELDAVVMSLPGVVRQHVVRRADGSFVARPDFAIPELKIAIEGHSRRHHFGFEPEVSDAEREADLVAEGWLVRFITKPQITRPDELRASLLATVAARMRQFARPA